ncbi:MAG: glycogen-debranching protein [Methylococcales bacterium]|nr:glycogen-debranching protein [Methylococcales bacterium]
MRTTTRFITNIGTRSPSGASWNVDATNFSIFSRQAIAVELLLYETEDCDEPMQVIVLDLERQRTFFSWHVAVKKLPVGTLYTWRVQKPDGSWWEVLDPWARAVSNKKWNRSLAVKNSSNGLRGIVSDLHYNPANLLARPKPKSLEGAIIYEVHVGGFTQHPSSGVQYPHTFKGLIEKIPYFKELGITHVELLPVMAFDVQDAPDGVMNLGNENYWGYSPYGFYAPHPNYCATSKPVDEFKELVQALHAADMGILLDVVFNHTSEGGEGGPTINFKALLDDIFYHHSPDRLYYHDYTGCGNTINCNHPLVTHFLVHCLEYWVNEMGVDGFRFDLASVFTRGEDGTPLANPSLPWSIELSHSLINAPIIAEAWDAAGLYQVGSFPGTRWAEWNGQYRDVMRRFVKGDRGLVNKVATCLTGSSDLYADDHRLPSSSVNFITCHDGFTLWDLVSHNEKHNMANGEENRDGTNDNLSWNCGAEGATDNPHILALRRQQARNFMAMLFLSQGVPMFLAGDEFLHTQGGNNNAWCQNNEISWLNWQFTETNKDMLRFVRELIAFRRRHPNLSRPRYLTGRIEPTRGIPDITWHGVHLNEPQWDNPESQILAFTLAGASDIEEDLHVVINITDHAIDVPLPVIAQRRWYLAMNTAAPSPDNMIERAHQQLITSDWQAVSARSIVVYEARETVKSIINPF